MQKTVQTDVILDKEDFHVEIHYKNGRFDSASILRNKLTSVEFYSLQQISEFSTILDILSEEIEKNKPQ